MSTGFNTPLYRRPEPTPKSGGSWWLEPLTRGEFQQKCRRERDRMSSSREAGAVNSDRVVGKIS